MLSIDSTQPALPWGELRDEVPARTLSMTAAAAAHRDGFLSGMTRVL